MVVYIPIYPRRYAPESHGQGFGGKAEDFDAKAKNFGPKTKAKAEPNMTCLRSRPTFLKRLGAASQTVAIKTARIPYTSLKVRLTKDRNESKTHKMCLTC